MSDSECDYSSSVQCEPVKTKPTKVASKRKIVVTNTDKKASTESLRSDSECEYSSSQCEPVKSKPAKGASKRKIVTTNTNKKASTESLRTSRKKTSFDVFDLQQGEEVVKKKIPSSSVFYNRVANGQTRRVLDTDGEFYVELKVFHSSDVTEGGDDLWKKSLLWLKLRTDSDTPQWNNLQKFVKQAHVVFEKAEPTFYSENIKFK